MIGVTIVGLGMAVEPHARSLLDLAGVAQVRWAAARGLGRLGHPSAVAPLLAAVDGPCAVPVDVVAGAVFAIRDCPLSLLRQALASPSVPTRTLALICSGFR